jgi:putative MATE family efflux protein
MSVAGDRTLPSPADRLTQGPVLPLILSLALPNMVAMVSAAAVSIAETAYVGALGRDALAAMAVVFPFVMLMQTVSGGAMGGAISAAVSRALGANRDDAARSLALHAAVIGLVGGLLFLAVFLLFGPALYRLLGARDAVLQQALLYSNVLFIGAPFTWLTNSLVSVVRGSGNIRFSALLIVGATLLQVALGAGLGLGLGPFPRWGMAGVALGQVLAFSAATLVLLWYLRSPLPRVPLVWRGMALQRESFAQILRVGLLGSLSPVQNVLTVLVLTGLIARLGVDALAGYGIGARLEFLLIPLSFGIGVTLVPLVGMAIGRGDVARARRVAWTGALLAGAVVGTIGLWACIWPRGWASLFTDQPMVLAQAELYLRWAGPGFAFYGFGITLYFASQGAGQVLGPVLGATMRLAVIAIGGALLAQAQAPGWAYFALVSAAMLAYGLFNAAALARTDWRRAVTAVHGAR